MMSLMPKDAGQGLELPKSGGCGESIVSLAPLYRSIFVWLLKGDGAVHYHCSAGQDRTGIASALILSALGVPREQTLRDYHLSTPLRKIQYEMQPIDPEKHKGNPVALMFLRVQEAGAGEAQPLYGEDGISILAATFEMIDERWGSTDKFLHEVIGLTDADIERLKNLYLE